MKQEHSFKSSDGKSTVFWTEWVPDDKPVTEVLQIIHGMSEYIDRYDDFARWLNGYGIAVAGNDHIGHGRSADPSDYGYMGEEDGWNMLADDAEIMNGILREKFAGVPVSVMGHSMGSFVIRNWMSKHGAECDKFIIMGTGGSNPALPLGQALARLIRKRKGGHARSKLITAMAFGSYNRHIKDAKTYHDWLTRDDKVVAAYRDDPACGFTFTLAGYDDLFSMLRYINSDECYACYKNTVASHPILLISGWEDPVGNYGKGPAEVCDRLKESGCTEVSMLLFEDMRHEVLNEFGKEAVYKEIKEFLLS